MQFVIYILERSLMFFMVKDHHTKKAFSYWSQDKDENSRNQCSCILTTLILSSWNDGRLSMKRDCALVSLSLLLYFWCCKSYCCLRPPTFSFDFFLIEHTLRVHDATHSKCINEIFIYEGYENVKQELAN